MVEGWEFRINVLIRAEENKNLNVRKRARKVRTVKYNTQEVAW